MDNVTKTIRAAFALGLMVAIIWLAAKRICGRNGCYGMGLGADSDDACVMSVEGVRPIC